VQPYVNFSTGSATLQVLNTSAFDSVGLRRLLRVIYKPSMHLVGGDLIQFTFRDVPPQGMADSLFVTSAPLQFAFTIAAVDGAPVVYDTVHSLPTLNTRGGLPFAESIRYYDVELPHAQLVVSLGDLTTNGTLNATINVTTEVATGFGTVTLANSSFLNKTTASDAPDALVFVYTPAGGEYSGRDSFDVWVSDGVSVTRATITLVDPNPLATRLSESA
jgi:hypothetical protein